MRPTTVYVGPLAAASANAICLSQTPTSGTALSLNGAFVSGGVAVLDVTRRVLFTVGSEGAQRTIDIAGTDWAGNSISETVIIPASTAGTVSSVLDYKTVTSLLPAGGGFTAALTVGTSSVAGSRWVKLDDYGFAPTSIQVDATGTVNYTVQQTLDDPTSLTDPISRASVTWLNHPDPTLVGATASAQGNYGYIPSWVRVVLNSGTGSISMTVIQAGPI